MREARAPVRVGRNRAACELATRYDSRLPHPHTALIPLVNFTRDEGDQRCLFYGRPGTSQATECHSRLSLEPVNAATTARVACT